MNCLNISFALSNPIEHAIKQTSEKKANRDFIAILPNELIISIFENLSSFDLQVASQVCRHWRSLAQSRDLMLAVFQNIIQKLCQETIPKFIINHLNNHFVFVIANQTLLATGKWTCHPVTQQLEIDLQTPPYVPDGCCAAPDFILYAHKQSPLIMDRVLSLLPQLSLQLEMQQESLLSRKFQILEEAIQQVNLLMKKQCFTGKIYKLIHLPEETNHHRSAA